MLQDKTGLRVTDADLLGGQIVLTFSNGAVLVCQAKDLYALRATGLTVQLVEASLPEEPIKAN